MNAQKLKEFVQALPPNREEAVELYQYMLVKQNEAQGDEFYRRQEICYAVEDELIRRGFINPRGPCFPSH